MKKAKVRPEEPGMPEPAETESEPLFFDQTTEYIKDPKTGKWIVFNPSGSNLYNNLTRDKTEPDGKNRP